MSKLLEERIDELEKLVGKNKLSTMYLEGDSLSFRLDCANSNLNIKFLIDRAEEIEQKNSHLESELADLRKYARSVDHSLDLIRDRLIKVEARCHGEKE